MDLSAKELVRVQMAELAADHYVPLEDRINQYMEHIREEGRLDPLGLSDEANVLMKPFYFYGGYVAMST